MTVRINKPSHEIVEKGRRFADAIQLTEEEERAAFSVYFSLTTFFGAAMEIPAVRELLEEVVDKPLWSIVRQRGVQPSFNFFSTAARAVAEIRAGVPNSIYQIARADLPERQAWAERDLCRHPSAWSAHDLCGNRGALRRTPHDTRATALHPRAVGATRSAFGRFALALTLP